MHPSIEQAVAERAQQQYGLITRAQLFDLGLRAGAVRGLLESGRFLRLYAGIYVAGPILLPPAREFGAFLACGPRSALSHSSAAAILDLVPADADPEVSVPGNRRQRSGIRVHRVRTLESTLVDGIPVTTPARTLIDLAASLSPFALEQAVGRALRNGLVSRTELLDRVSRTRGVPGVGTLRALLNREDEPAFVRSEAEARALRLFRDGNLPAPKTNMRVHGFELDFYWPEHRIAVEVDGYQYHSSRDAFERDHSRATVLAEHGVQVIPITWRQIVNEPVATAVRIGKALLRAELSRPAAQKGGTVAGSRWR